MKILVRCLLGSIVALGCLVMAGDTTLGAEGSEPTVPPYLLAASMLSSQPFSQPFVYDAPSGQALLDDEPPDAQSTTGPNPPADVDAMGLTASEEATSGVLDVPAYIWHHGCGPTAAGMIIGYWDSHGFDALVSGDAHTQTSSVDAMIASEGAASNYSDYCEPLDSLPDPIQPDKSEPPSGDEHPDDSVADYMRTSQSHYNNYYGWSWFSNVGPAMKGYVDSLAVDGYHVTTRNLYMQSFPALTWDSFRAEIDAGRPLVFLVDTDANGATDHFIAVIGYDDSAGSRKYAALNTWDTAVHWYSFEPMTPGQPWGIFGAVTFSVETHHCGTINSDETWSSSGNVHVVDCDVIVAEGATLTIADGAIVKFAGGKALTVNGSLRVMGTEANPVYLTSYRDDTIGGDTNGDGASTGSRGDWRGIRFTDASNDSTSLIDHAVIRYGGANWEPNYGAITLDDASPTVQNTEIRESYYCAVTGDMHSFPELSGNTLVNNDANGLCLLGGTLDLDATWDMTDTSYYLRESVTVAVGKTLTVDPGVVVKMAYGKTLTVDGALRAMGTAPGPVVFTSYRDDVYGGDTDGGGASTGGRGDWHGIRFTDTSNDGTSLIDHAMIRYGGYNYAPNYGAITLDDASPTMQNTEIRESDYCAITADMHSFPELSGITLVNNDANGFCLLGGTLDLDATWDVTDTSYYLRDSVTVAVGKTLTVDPGVVVKIAYGKALTVNGALRVLGMPLSPVTITSHRDDVYGGDTNGDGASTGGRGDWLGIRFTDTSNDSTSLIDHAMIRYGGHNYAPNYGAITLDNASPTVQNTEIRESYYCAVTGDMHSFPVLSGNTLVNNDANGLCLLGGTLDLDATWDVTDTSYYLRNSVTIAVGKTLTVEPDVVVKLGNGKTLTVDGALRVMGTAPGPVVFTSYRDDVYGGDTDGGGASSGGRGDWHGIRFTDTSNDGTSLIDRAMVRYGGYNYAPNYGAITLDDASPKVQNTEIRESYYCAVTGDMHSFPMLSGNTLVNNDANGFCLLGGTLDLDATWDVTDTSYYLRDSVTVAVGKTLTVEPDVVVKLGNGKTLTVDGVLRVLGTGPAPVVITSYRDDVYGGDTNGDGASTGGRGDWHGIRFTDTSNDGTSLIDHAMIRYGGYNYTPNYGAITLDDASPTVQNTEIRESDYCAITADMHSFPELSGNTLVNNDANGFCLLGGTLDVDATWDVTDTSYYLRNSVTIAVGKTLTVGPYVVVKLASGRSLTVNGGLRVEGTTSSPVVITSYRDDVYRGDTDGGGASTGSKGDWQQIRFADSSDDASSMSHVVVRYGGGSGYLQGALRFDSSSPTLAYSTVSMSDSVGIRTDSSAPSLVCNNILQNDDYGVYNATPGILVDAEDQWWGDPSGPYHATDNPTGLGNAVSDGVDFIPWATSSCPPGTSRPAPSDFDGDGKTDPAKFDSSTNTLSYLESSTGTWRDVGMGSGTIEYVRRSDFDGDGKTDPAMFIPAAGSLWYRESSSSTWQGVYMGPGSYQLVTGSDFDGDGKTDPALFYTVGGANALWYLESTTSTWQGVYMGPGSYELVMGSDFDGDGKTDPALFYTVGGANALWYRESSSATWLGVYMGPGTYEMAPASDFDGDGKTDPALFCAAGGANALWYLESSAATWQGVYMGPGTYTYVSGTDFDGDGKTDPTEFVSGTQTMWWLKSSTSSWDGAWMGAGTYEVVN